MYFDDQESHCEAAAKVVSTGKYPIPVVDAP